VLVLVAGAAGAGIMFAVLAGTGGATAQLTRKTRELQERQQRMEQEAVEAKQRERIATTKARLQAHKDEIASILRLVQDFEDELKKWKDEVVALQDNERGKNLAAGDYYTQAYRATLREPRASHSDVQSIQQQLETLAKPIDDALARDVTTYEPSQDLVALLQQARQTLLADIGAYADGRRRIDALVQQAARELPPATFTLKEAIQKLEARETDEQARAIVAREEAARKKAIEDLAQAKEKQIQQQGEDAVKKVEAETAAKKKQNEDAISQEQAKSDLEHAKKAAEEKRIRDEAQKTALRKEAHSDEVQKILAPFITPGFWQPAGKGPIGKKTTTKAGVSLKAIIEQGALEQSDSGVARLYRIACAPLQDRPLWGARTNDETPAGTLRRLTAEQVEVVKKAQDLLIRLGPTLVEEGLLSE
jgi:hypothetical protein